MILNHTGDDRLLIDLVHGGNLLRIIHNLGLGQLDRFRGVDTTAVITDQLARLRVINGILLAPLLASKY